MESFQTAAYTVLPMFVFMAIGYVICALGVVKENVMEGISVLCFRIFLSMSIYYNIYIAEITEVFDKKLLLYAIAAQLLIVVISLVVANFYERTASRRGALAHGIFHTNFVIFGTTIGTALYGEGNIGVIALLIAIIVPIQNVISVAVLEYFRSKNNIKPVGILVEIIKNPYVIAALAGLITKFLGISLPYVVEEIVMDLSRCGTPIALIAMGGLFKVSIIKENLKSLSIGIIFRLVIIPAIMLTVAVLFGFRGIYLAGLMCIFIAPCAVSSFNLACVMDSDRDLTAQMIVFTSLFSLMTTFIWVYLLDSNGVL